MENGSPLESIRYKLRSLLNNGKRRRTSHPRFRHRKRPTRTLSDKGTPSAGKSFSVRNVTAVGRIRDLFAPLPDSCCAGVVPAGLGWFLSAFAALTCRADEWRRWRGFQSHTLLSKIIKFSCASATTGGLVRRLRFTLTFPLFVDTYYKSQLFLIRGIEHFCSRSGLR